MCACMSLAANRQSADGISSCTQAPEHVTSNITVGDAMMNDDCDSPTAVLPNRTSFFFEVVGELKSELQVRNEYLQICKDFSPEMNMH